MARIRTIKPEFWRHEALCDLPEATHMLAAALLNYADDYGYFNANPKLIEGELYPLRKPSVKIPESLRSLQTIGYIELGEGHDGRRYGRITHFTEHQRVSHPTESKISCLSIAWERSGNSPEKIEKPQETFVPEQGTGKGKEQGTGKIVRASRFEDFWKVCPKKVGRGKAEAAYAKACKLATEEVLISEMASYAASQADKDRTYTAHPATWLKEKRWLDEGLAPSGPLPTPEEIEAARDKADKYFKRGKYAVSMQ